MNDLRSNEKHLAELLRELEAELAGADSLDEAGRERLRAVQAQLARALGDSERAADLQRSAVIEPVQRAIDEFEKTHPTLTLTLGRILDTLNKIGV
ncbi:MAG TPA: DUF4404 family protein [Gammaproteobacteria bacterium]|nr:DUF4404 family protein [Gammaproteobacteria bacterium]